MSSYSLRPSGHGSFEVFDTVTGAGHFYITAYNVQNYFSDGQTATIVLENGQTQIWDLVKRQLIRWV